VRFLCDQSTDRRLALVLRQEGDSDVTVVAVDHPPSLPDSEVLAIALRERRVLVTEDRDFGELIFRERQAHAGVLFLRLPPMELEAKVAIVRRALSTHADDLNEFVVVTRRNVRVRRREQEDRP
jgi:predicted nuclease of predicted toxin-antitoxin system